jgi:hypothetical protein
MKRHLPATLAALIFCALFAPAAHAQIGVYGQFNGTHDPNIGGWYTGGTFGVYDDVLHEGPLHAGFDIRAGFAGGHQYSYHDFLFGPRLAFKPPVLPIKPYIQGEIGFGGTKFTGRSGGSYNNHFQSGIMVGLDYTILPRIDLRIPEIGYEKMSGVGMTTLGFGVVIRLP